MGLARLRVRMPDVPGELGRLAGVIAGTGSDIVSIDVQRVADGDIVDVLLVRLPNDLEPEGLLRSVRRSYRAELAEADVDRSAVGDLVVQVVDTIGALLAAEPSIHAVERGVRGILDVEAAWVVPVDPSTSGIAGDAAETGLPVAARSQALRCHGDGGGCWVLGVPLAVDTPDPLVVLAARSGAAFTDSEIARARGMGRLIAAANLALYSDPLLVPHLPTTDKLRWPRRLRTDDGQTLTVRPAVPTDRIGLLRLHAACTQRSVRRRLLVPRPVLHPADLDTLLGHDHDDGLALVVQADRRIVGLGNLATRDPSSGGELGLLVADDWQHRGIGGQLFGLLMECAQWLSWPRIRAFAHADNRPMRALLDRLPNREITASGHGTVEVSAELAAGHQTEGCRC